MIAATDRAPYRRLGSLYFIYFAAVGVVLPYWGYYLHSLGLSAAKIGVLVSIPMATKILAPFIWGLLADNSGRYTGVIRFGAFCSAVAFTGVLVRTDFWGLAGFALLFSFFWNAILPQFEVITLDALGDRVSHYSRIRLWGSIGFIVSVVLLGWFFDALGVQTLPWVLGLLLVLIFLATLALPVVHNQKPGRKQAKFGDVLRRLPVRNFFYASLMLHVSHGVFYGFFTLHLAAHGYSTSAIGGLWAVGVIAEIVLFFFVPSIFARFTLWHCYLLGFIASALRWCLVGAFPTFEAIILLSQLLHALTFGLTHAVAIDIVRQSFDAEDRGKAQALYSALCFGGGGAIGAILSGLIWAYGGWLGFVFAAFTSAAGALIVAFGMRFYRHRHDRAAQH